MEIYVSFTKQNVRTDFMMKAKYKEFLLNLPFLNYLQLKITLMPKRHILKRRILTVWSIICYRDLERRKRNTNM